MGIVVHTSISNWWGKAIAYGGLHFPNTGCPVSDVYICYVFDQINI